MYLRTCISFKSANLQKYWIREMLHLWKIRKNCRVAIPFADLPSLVKKIHVVAPYLDEIFAQAEMSRKTGSSEIFRGRS